VKLALTLLFLALAAYAVHPLAKRLFAIIDARARTPNAELVAVVVISFLMAAATEHIGVHALFGAFVAGCMLRQVPHLHSSTVHRLEAVSVSIFAPVFFASVGLKVNLHALTGSNIVWVVLGVATAGKLIGCLAGGLTGGMRFWESVSIAVAMNARGAMGLVVAVIGLNGGLLNDAMFASIVVMAIVTSFAAPLGLRLTLRFVPMSPDEKARLAEQARGVFDPARVKVLIPTAGGPHALAAGRLAAGVVRGETSMLMLLYVQSATVNLFRRIWQMFRPDMAGRNLQEHLDRIKAFAQERQVRVEVTRASEPEPALVVAKEARNGYDLVLVGGGMRSSLRSQFLSDLLEVVPCHVAIVSSRAPTQSYEEILVATNGSYFSQAATELALLYAERAHANVTLLYTMESEQPMDEAPSSLDEGFRRMFATTLLMTLSPLLAKTTARVNVIVRETDQPTVPVLTEARSGQYQLLVVGSEDRAVQHRITVGFDIERIAKEADCTVAVVVPKIAGPKA
jgi:nucleotide-binding universal stress UspA family protein